MRSPFHSLRFSLSCRAGSFCLLAVMGVALVKASEIPVSTSPPGGLSPADTPQLILITFDDAVNAVNYEDILKITDHRNADGSPISMTFYISVDFSDYYLLHKLHAAGHEIAVHTMTHTTGNLTPFETWIREIEGCRESLVRYAGIPREEITGFRSPYLAYNAETFRAISLLGFEYDSSVPETSPGLYSPDEANYIWPYTLHDGLKQNTWTGTGPAEPLPGLIEIPMWNLIGLDQVHNMDPTTSSEAEMLDLLKTNFTTRYEGNRVPVGIYFHAGWLTHDANTNAMNAFLEWALAKPDVYVVGAGKLAKWMRNPVSAATAATEGTFFVHSYDPVPESEVIMNSLTPYGFRSVLNAASVYPTPETAFLRTVEVVEPIAFRIEITQMFGSSYQANLLAENTGTRTIHDWQVEVEAGDNTLSWMWPGSHTREGNRILITPNGVNDLPPGETVVASFGGNGDPETYGSLQVTLRDVALEAPRLRSVESPTGVKLRWNRVSPMVELQARSSLGSGEWLTLKTLYGAEETSVQPADTPLFYRLRCIH